MGTYKQWQEKGVQVRKGEKAHQIVFYKDFEKEEENEKTGEIETVKRFVLKASSVFNVAQVEGFNIAEEETTIAESTFDPYQKVEAFISKTGACVFNCFSSAFYHRSEDIIGMPDPSSFTDTETRTAKEAYNGVLLHELTHWTGHKSRLDRLVPTARFGSESYAIEEFVALLGSYFLCAELGITSPLMQDHANYIDNWLKVLENDKKAIFYAARQASLAADYIKQLVLSEKH